MLGFIKRIGILKYQTPLSPYSNPKKPNMSTTKTSTIIDLIRNGQWKAVQKKIEGTKSTLDSTTMKAFDSSMEGALFLALKVRAPKYTIDLLSDMDNFEHAILFKDPQSQSTPLHIAVRRHSSVASLLLKKADRISSSLREKLLSAMDRNGMNPIHVALTFGSSFQTIRTMLQNLSTDWKRSYLNIPTTQRKSPLYLACECLKTTSDTLSFLLDQGATYENEESPSGNWKPLHVLACPRAFSLRSESGRDERREMIATLVQRFPEACFETTDSGLTPVALFFSDLYECSDIYEYEADGQKDIVRLLLGLKTYNTFRDGKVSNDDRLKECEIGVVHKALCLPQHVPGLMEFLLEHFPSDCQIL